MSIFDRINIKPGDPIKAADMMAIVEAVRNPRLRVRAGDGISARQQSNGDVAITAQTRHAFLATANGAIPARSGATPGTGQATACVLNASGNIVATALVVDVYNFSAAAGGIDSGKYLWVEEGPLDGRYWVVSAEC